MTAGRPAGHTPRNRGVALPGTKKAARTSSRLVREFFTAIDATGLSAGSIGKLAGVHSVSLSRWKHGHASPTLTDFENAAQALGYRLMLVPVVDCVDRDDGQQSTNGAL